MTPKVKAENLLNKYWKSCYDKHDFAKLNKEDAKQCALIAADEVINTIMSVYQPETKAFWFEVKKEIEEL